jgi:hypothetical protein
LGGWEDEEGFSGLVFFSETKGMKGLRGGRARVKLDIFWGEVDVGGSWVDFGLVVGVALTASAFFAPAGLGEGVIPFNIVIER